MPTVACSRGRGDGQQESWIVEVASFRAEWTLELDFFRARERLMERYSFFLQEVAEGHPESPIVFLMISRVLCSFIPIVDERALQIWNNGAPDVLGVKTVLGDP